MRWWLLAILTACTTTQPVAESLADQRDAMGVSVHAVDTETTDSVPPATIPPQIEVDFDPPDCAAFSPTARVTVGDTSAQIANPSRDTAGNCIQGQARLELAVGSLTGQPLTIEIADDSDTWTLTFAGLANTALQFPASVTVGQTGTMTWVDGPHIDNGCFRIVEDPFGYENHGCKNDPHIRVPSTPGNTIEVDVSPLWPQQVTIALDAVGEYDAGPVPGGPSGGPPLACDGPASCWILLAVNRTFSVTVVH